MNFRLKKSALLIAHATTLMLLAACGGANQEDSTGVLDTSTEMEEAERVRWRSIDTIDPNLGITGSPTTAGTGIVGLKGWATDNMRLYRVRWSNSRGGSGSATLSGYLTQATWSAASIQLQTGDNTITVTAEDAAGNTSRVSRRW